jgi:hypothetical protein
VVPTPPTIADVEWLVAVIGDYSEVVPAFTTNFDGTCSDIVFSYTLVVLDELNNILTVAEHPFTFDSSTLTVTGSETDPTAVLGAVFSL